MEERQQCYMISVIIPVYNGGKYIDGLFRNLRAQQETAEHFELVFIDDGSKDDSFARLAAAEDGANFTVAAYRQENAGVSAARNAGIRYAKGEYITFADVDDFVTADYFATLEKAVRAHDFDVLMFNSLRVHDGDAPHLETDDAVFCPMTKDDMLQKVLYNPTAFGVVNLLLRREFVKKQALLFAEGYKYYEDYDFIYRTLATAEKLLFTDKILYFYILREGSAMQRFTADRLTCLVLMQRLEAWFPDVAPSFAPYFSKWGTNRIFWSILWQAALAFSRKDFTRFAAKTDAMAHLLPLCDCPNKKVRLSARLYRFSPALYYMAVRLMGRGHSKVQPAVFADFEDAANTLSKE